MAETVSPHIVVVGSGLAGYGVLRELRKLAPDARLTLVTLDDGHFYSKPALSTALAKGKVADTLVPTPAAKSVAQRRLVLRAGRAGEATHAAGKGTPSSDERRDRNKGGKTTRSRWGLCH